MTLEHTRRAVPGTSNLRDLGGLRTVDGRTVAAGFLFRSEAMVLGESDSYAVYRPEAEEELGALGLRTVVDLRAERESDRAPSVWANVSGANLVLLPIAEGGEGADTNYMRLLLDGEIERFDADSMFEFYVRMLARRSDVLGVAFRLLADPRNFPLLVHCAAGKDRTGVFVALVLSALGIPRDVVVEDYALTGVLRPNRIDTYAHLFREAGLNPEKARGLFESPAAAMQSTLSHLDSEYGGVAGYLTGSCGVHEWEIDAVKENLLVS